MNFNLARTTKIEYSELSNNVSSVFRLAGRRQRAVPLVSLAHYAATHEAMGLAQ